MVEGFGSIKELLPIDRNNQQAGIRRCCSRFGLIKELLPKRSHKHPAKYRHTIEDLLLTVETLKVPPSSKLWPRTGPKSQP